MKLPLVIRQQRKINTLENKLETLEQSLKEKLYKSFIEKLDEPYEVERLKKENKRLRAKIKEMKENGKDKK